MNNPGSHYNQGTKKGQIFLGLVLVASTAVVGSVLWWFSINIQLQKEIVSTPQAQVEVVQEDDVEQKISSVEEIVSPVLFQKKELQDVLENWEDQAPGMASVVLMLDDGSVLASINKDKQYFAASIYKLYVAYAGYMQVDSELVDPGEIYINGNTRLECLDLMIRESDSPCGEKLWNELGKSELNTQLEGYGIENTTMVSLRTTAYDAAVMLARIARSEGLSSASQKALLTSMKNQIYRDALNAGFSDDVIVYNKIGFNGLVEYHDTAIVEFKDGRQLIVSVLTEEVKTTNIAKLGRAIEESIGL